tara:strand:+ start:6325 stop:8664 length:2340 start_codon:yes stop_codon:yes gene_type:complete
MKSILQKLILVLFVSLISFSAYAQFPEGFSFQAAARGLNGELLVNQDLGIKISVLKGSETGDDVYSETHNITTNAAGIIQLVIGDGFAAEGQSFSAVNFGNDNYFVKLAIDPTGGTEYADLGTTRLLSVPYALVAKNVVNGGGPGGTITEYNLNTANSDSSFVINIVGDKTAKPFQVFSKSTEYNGAVWGEAISEISNESNQRGVLGFANGTGTGNHIGVFGGAVNFDGTGEKRVGLYGQAASKAKLNFGVQGIVQGDGNGNIVPIGEEVEGDFGSYNIAGGFYSSGNLNGNVGVEAQTSGNNGSRADFGVISRAIGSGNSPNIGVRGEAFNSTVQNVAFEGDASGGGTKNLGLRLNVFNGTSNIGMEVNADTAAILNGHSIINGDLTVNGNVFGAFEGGNVNGQTLDSLFFSTKPEVELQRNSALYPGSIKLQDGNGSYSNLSRTALQYGDTDTEGTGFVYNWYSKGGMQVANPDYLNGEKSSGMSGGYFYMDIANNENFYVPLQFGIGTAAEGGRSWFEMSSLKRAEDGKGAAYRVGIVNDPNGNDPNGESAEVMLWGDDAPNIQIGGQQWENTNLGYLNMYGSTSDGGGWFHSNANLSIGTDGTSEWGSLILSKSNIAGQSNQETINIDGNSGNISISGVYDQSSDVRLKKDIQTLDNALEKTLKMRGVSYNWKSDVSNENPQIGVIAQEVEKIYPEFVHTDEGGMKSVNYAQMTAVLIEAVKALNVEIQELKTDNLSLQAKLDTQSELEQRLSKIEKLLSVESILQSNDKVTAEK